MGAGQSTSSEAHPPTRGLHILRVTPSSPASHSDIEAWFDFVVGFEGDSLSPQHNIDASELEKIVERHEGRTLNLFIWSSKNRETRVVPIIPSREWSTAHTDGLTSTGAQPSLLGLSMRMCEPEPSLDNVWHVLDVIEGSPAESAGLVPYGDWIVGWSGGALHAEGDFYDLVEAHVDKPLRVYVYNIDFDTLREVLLVPNRQWGGDGLLGCVFGFGLLHRIPPPSSDRQPGDMPPELQGDFEEYEHQELFVPADFDQSNPPTQESTWRYREEEGWDRESEVRQPRYQPTSHIHHPPIDNHHSNHHHHEHAEHDHAHYGHHGPIEEESPPARQTHPYIPPRTWTPSSFANPSRPNSRLNGLSAHMSTKLSPSRSPVSPATTVLPHRAARSENEMSIDYENRTSISDTDHGSEHNSAASLTSVD